jgi:hypothetical protein
MADLRRRFVERYRVRRDEARVEIDGSPREDDRRWVEELIDKRGWRELRGRKAES